MLFSEFQENTGCRDNDYNHKLYTRLELIYMNDDSVTKQEIYDMGKKLMDNTPSQAELEIIEKMQAEIDYYKGMIASYKKEIENQEYISRELYFDDKAEQKARKRHISYLKDEIKSFRREIAKCKFVLSV